MENNNKDTLVLFVDDDESIRMALSAMAESLNYNYLIASDSFEAIEAAFATQFRVI